MPPLSELKLSDMEFNLIVNKLPKFITIKHINDNIPDTKQEVIAIVEDMDISGNGSIIKTYVYTLKQSDIDEGSIIIPAIKLNSEPIISCYGGITQLKNVDYVINNNILTWKGFGLESLLEKDDIIIMHYQQ